MQKHYGSHHKGPSKGCETFWYHLLQGIFGAITKDSIGMGSYLERLLELMGIRMLETMTEYGRQKEYDQVMNKKL
jgi:hypothetical protein